MGFSVDSIINPDRRHSELTPAQRRAEESRRKTEDFFRDALESIAFGDDRVQHKAESSLQGYIGNHWYCDNFINRMVTLAKARPYAHYWTVLNPMIFQMGAISVEDYEEAAVLQKEIDEKREKYALEFINSSRA